MNRVFKLVELAKKRFGEAQSEYYMLSRPIGAEDAETFIKNEIMNTPAGFTFVLDFQNIKLADVSYVDEVLLTPIVECCSGLFGERYIAVANINEGTMNNLEAAILYRDKNNKEFVPVVNKSNSKNVIIGNLEKSLRDTYDYLVLKEQVTAKDIVNHFDIDHRNASTRLKRLYDYRLVKRQALSDENGFYYELL